MKEFAMHTNNDHQLPNKWAKGIPVKIKKMRSS